MDPNLYQASQPLVPDQERVAQLYQLAVSPRDPQTMEARVRTGLLLVAALLLGCGLIFWIAANWQEQSRLFKLSLIEAALASAVLAACLWPRMRVAALFCATLVLGGLLAFVGQTYQTGADAWQLFAVWAALSLIWVGMLRSDWLWLLWVLIVALGIVMWTGRLDWWDVLFLGNGSQLSSWLNIGLWLALLCVPTLVSLLPWLRVQGGMGWWSHRAALACALAVWSSMFMLQIFDFEARGTGAVLVCPLALVAASLVLSLKGRFQDYVSLCLATLAVNVLLLSAAARVLVRADIGGLLIFAMLGLACLGGSVRWLVSVQQRMREEQA